jgi:hypothetical protein
MASVMNILLLSAFSVFGLVRVLGATHKPVPAWVVQQARNLLVGLGNAEISVKLVLHDQDASFTAAFGRLPGRRCEGRPVSPLDTADELDHGTLDRHLPA